jgi:hypothetical protein
MNSRAIRWLHLSDFHVGKDEYAQRRMAHLHVRFRFQARQEPVKLSRLQNCQGRKGGRSDKARRLHRIDFILAVEAKKGLCATNGTLEDFLNCSMPPSNSHYGGPVCRGRLERLPYIIVRIAESFGVASGWAPGQTRLVWPAAPPEPGARPAADPPWRVSGIAAVLLR